MAKSKAKAKVAKVTEVKEEVKVTPEVKPGEEIKPEADAVTTPKDEEKNLPEKEMDKEIKKVEEKMEILGKVKSPVFQKSSFIKTKAYNAPVCLYELPEDLRKYLTNMGFGTNVYEKGEEWLIKHGADMKMIEKLKKFISEHYL